MMKDPRPGQQSPNPEQLEYYDPTKLTQLFAQRLEISRRYYALDNELEELGSGEENTMSPTEYEKKYDEIQNSHQKLFKDFPDNAFRRQLQSDIILLSKNTPNKLKDLLQANQQTVSEYLESDNRTRQTTFKNILKPLIKGVAKAHGWEITYHEMTDADDRQAIPILISDGARTISLQVALWEAEGKTFLDDAGAVEKKFGRRNLIGFYGLYNGNAKRYSQPNRHEARKVEIDIDTGNIPEIWQEVTEEDVKFLEKVIACYY